MGAPGSPLLGYSLCTKVAVSVDDGEPELLCPYTCWGERSWPDSFSKLMANCGRSTFYGTRELDFALVMTMEVTRRTGEIKIYGMPGKDGRGEEPIYRAPVVKE
jgi:hypothetical protein